MHLLKNTLLIAGVTLIVLSMLSLFQRMSINRRAVLTGAALLTSGLGSMLILLSVDNSIIERSHWGPIILMSCFYLILAIAVTIRMRRQLKAGREEWCRKLPQVKVSHPRIAEMIEWLYDIDDKQVHSNTSVAKNK